MTVTVWNDRVITLSSLYYITARCHATGTLSQYYRDALLHLDSETGSQSVTRDPPAGRLAGVTGAVGLRAGLSCPALPAELTAPRPALAR